MGKSKGLGPVLVAIVDNSPGDSSPRGTRDRSKSLTQIGSRILKMAKKDDSSVSITGTHA